ncbi:FBXL12 isoform 4 [Pan troglodytes]|uniref:F-box and leucine rich repeat protein 12 n=2 Tax=Homininae TaxID=207598 RepID=K7EIK3_HUMAN|nr:F-box and leucine rich repeat protein 12 [Homo sapiens]KAI4040238.1 F-box and leucine rich repeat protein 12 [Homo sapiens]PNI51710.1 FBXL12 isoform 4 [Pan troglodytes]
MATLVELPDSVLLEIFSYLPGLSPLEEAGGRPVAVATCRPDALHGPMMPSREIQQ